MSHFDNIAYDFLLAILSLCLIVLGIILIIMCRKKPVKSGELSPPIKLCARAYSLTDIDAATDSFSNRRIIGQGRLGTVYAAVLSTGELVAVKRIHPWLVLTNAGFGFSSVIKSLSLAHHPNIVPILGFSQAPGERIIVSEFVNMASLDFYLHENEDDDDGAAALLDWSRRLRIAAGAARGIEYLHGEMMASNIIHGCIKASNILLDEKFCARVCDYGLSFLSPPKERRGLVGYVDDEYWSSGGGGGGCGGGGPTRESDVYGFGVVLLEILTGRRCEEGLLVKWALPLIKEMRFSELLDPRLVIPDEIKPLVRLAKVALACVGNSRKDRPSIVQVATILNNLMMKMTDS